MPLLLLLTIASFQIDQQDQQHLVAGLKRLDRCRLDFKQETYSDFMDPSFAAGTLSLKRPGKLRMDYNEGERKTFICDGQTYYEYDQLADTESRVPFEEIRNEPLVRLLLFGDNPAEHFIIDRYKEDGLTMYRLRPRGDDSYHILAQFNQEWLPTQIEVVSDDGEGTRFKFENYHFELDFAEPTFTVPPPVKP